MGRFTSEGGEGRRDRCPGLEFREAYEAIGVNKTKGIESLWVLRWIEKIVDLRFITLSSQ